MQRVVVDVPDDRLNFFMELLTNLGIKKVKKLSEQQKELVDDLQHSLKQVKQHQEGEIKLQSARDFLNEL